MSDLNIFEIYTFILDPIIRDESEPEGSEYAWEQTHDIPSWGQGVWLWLRDRGIKAEVEYLGSFGEDQYEEVIRVFIEGQDKATLFKMFWEPYIHNWWTPERVAQEKWDMRQAAPLYEQSGELIEAQEIVK